MNLKHLLTKALLVVAMLGGGTTASWAATTTVGSTDNTSGFWTSFSDYYTIQPNRSLRLSFTNHSDKAQTYHTWVGVITSDFDRAAAADSDTEGYWEYLVLRGDNGRWGNSAGAGTYTSNFTRSGNDDAAVIAWQDGTHVELTISRSGSIVTMRADMYSEDGDYYWEQMVITAGTGTQNIRFFLTTENGHLTDIAQNSVDASIYYFYQDYEDATDASSWSAPTISPTLVTGDATYGNYINHSTGSNNSRSTYTYFYSSTDFYQNNSYTLEFDMAIGYGTNNNSQNHSIGIFPDGWSIPGSNYGYSGNYLFKLVQNAAKADGYKINDTETVVELGQGTWNHYKLEVDGDNSTVGYTIQNSGSTITNGSGSLTLGEGVSYKAKGLYFLDARYNGTGKFDNFKIYGEGTETITTSVSTSAVNLANSKATIAVSTETNAVTSTIKQYYSTSPLLTSPVEISNGSVELASGTYYFYSVNTVSGSKSNSVQYAVEATETVSAPTVTISGGTLTLTAQGTSDAGASVSTYYVADEPSANPSTDGTLLTLNTPTEVPQGYYYIYSVSEYGNVSAEPVIVLSKARRQETFDFYTAADNGYTTLSNLGTGDSGDSKLSKVTNSAGTVAEFINGRIECSYANSNGSYWWMRNNGKGNTYNGLFVSSGKSDDLYVKVSAKDVVVFTWENSALTFSGTPNVYGDDLADGSAVVSGTAYLAKEDGYIKVHGAGYTTIKSIVVYSDDDDMVATPVLSSSANIVSVIPGGSADDDAEITSYYTTNGDAPTASSSVVADNEIVLGPGSYTVKVISYNATTSTASTAASIEVVVPATATIGTTGWTTFASSSALDLSGMTASSGSVTAYYASAVGNNKVTMTSTDATVPAGEGIMLKGTAGATITIPVAVSGTSISGNKLVGVTSETIITSETTNYANFYVLSNNNGKAEFQNLKDYLDAGKSVTINAGKAYLDATTASGSRLSIVFDDDVPTGIADMEEVRDVENDNVYTLSGQCISKPTKGMFIVNGKKVLVK